MRGAFRIACFQASGSGCLACSSRRFERALGCSAGPIRISDLSDPRLPLCFYEVQLVRRWQVSLEVDSNAAEHRVVLADRYIAEHGLDKK